ncbi:Zinc finger, C3HC4 type (RING finger)/Ring finger domain/zinc-RING finger domain/EF-hand domain pair/EF hand/EF-hand domain/Secreted protein acidic and rich in cysteine Ca binding region containing protein, putative [Leishmania guyanensis]
MAALCVGEDFCEEFTCAVCLDSWKDPIELTPCGHIFCKACAQDLKECPVCRKKIDLMKTPNRTLVNMAKQIRVKCMRCEWKGTREQGMSHVCGNASASLPSQPSRPSSVTTQPPQQHPTAANFPSPYTQQLPYSGYGSPPLETLQQGQINSSLWQSGAPTQPPQQSAGYSSSHANAYPGAAPSLGSGNAGGQGGYPSSNNYWSQTEVSYTGYNKQPPPSRSPQTRYQVIEPTGPRPWTLYGLDQAEYDQIVSLFVFFDDDDSGMLDRNEVGRLARWLNFANTPQGVKQIFDDMDFDHSGRLSLGEFLTWLRHNKPNPKTLYGLTQSQYNTIMMQFRMYDTNQDGCLEMGEFTRLVQNLGDVRDTATAQRLFQMIDRDRDGAISLHEFLIFRTGDD